MGVNSLLGILSGLGDLLGNLFTSIFTWLINTLVVPVVKCAIRVIIVVIQYFGATIFYEISRFLLGLIDFVEVLFRTLAGLAPVAGASQSIEMSINDGSGDLLIQMLTSTDVIQAFYATAIVGMFLLIITTIFQMIKVEYTTEGAQNSKSGIIGKSLKSLCNMLIVPLLCIFGVFIGNQVLDLIDTATGGGSSNKISGQLWITAATTAMVADNAFVKAALDYGINLKSQEEIENAGGLLGAGITIAVTKGFKSILDDKEASTPICALAPANYADRERIEDNFAQGLTGYNYGDIAAVMQYYNPFEINYLVLIFGAVIIIKCLFYTCFGLIDRLYQCVALFIVMPMVIGMSPVKDSLGSWRGKFMQKALSAYGTVISLNLFFIIVSVLLNVKITIKGFDDWVFTPSFMEGLIKSIMVIVGCLMIEKLAGDLGGYFGAGNAMAEGKGLAKEATAGLQKAATVGMGVATMSVKAAGGIAGKVGKGTHALADKVSGGRLTKLETSAKTKVTNAAGAVGKAVTNWKPVKATTNFVKGKANSIKNFVDETAAGATGVNKAKKDAAEKTATYETAQARADLLKKRYEGYRGHKDKNKKAWLKAQKDADAAKGEMDAANQVVSNNQSKVDKYRADRSEKIQQKTGNVVRKVVTTKNALGQLYQNKFGGQAVFNAVAPKGVQNLQKDYQTALKEGNDTPEGQAMLAALAESKKKAKEESYNKDPLNALGIGMLNLQQTQLILDTTNAKLEQTNAETNKELQKMNDLLRDAISKYNSAGEGTAERSTYANKISTLQEAMIAKNSNIYFSGLTDIKTEAELKVDFKMDGDFMKKIQEQIKKGVKMDKIMDQINEEFKKIGLTDKDALAKIYKALEELKNNFSGK